MSKSYPPEFRRKVLDLVKAAKPVAQIAADVGVRQPAIYTWCKQEQIDTGERPGLSSGDRTELAAARRRIAQL
jgi:transposase-like protein